MGSTILPGSLELISRLLETLNQIVQYPPMSQDVSFIEQLLMSAIENTAEKVPVRLSSVLMRSSKSILGGSQSVSERHSAGHSRGTYQR